MYNLTPFCEKRRWKSQKMPIFVPFASQLLTNDKKVETALKLKTFIRIFFRKYVPTVDVVTNILTHWNSRRTVPLG
jgi:hypothetical protein